MLNRIFLYIFLMFSVSYAQNPILNIQTSSGDITVELFSDIAPLAVENFMTHSKSGYYNGTIFHRVIKNFMIQGGDPTGTGRGGESIWKQTFADEFKPNIVFDQPGLLAMANRGKNTNGSQFFITTNKTPWLNGGHTIFGKVIGGMDVVRKIENTATDANDKPFQPQIIESIIIK